MKIYTAALLPFEANEAFFARDSGLICRSLRGLGHESRVVLPQMEGGAEGDSSLIVRGSQKQLRDPSWWSSLGIDAVAFIAWGFKEHTAIIRAARTGGVIVVAIFDSSFNGYPYFDVMATFRAFWNKGFSDPKLKRIVGFIARITMFFFKGLFSRHHINVQARAANLSCYSSLSAFERMERQSRVFGKQIRPGMQLMGYPIPDIFCPRSLNDRKNRIIAIARWDAVRHKRPDVLMRVAEETVAKNRTAIFQIFGRISPKLAAWHSALPEALKQSIILSGVQPNEEVAKTVGESQVLYCPSASEGIPLPVYEALCGGCSVVGLDTPEIPGLHWAFHEGDGTPVPDDKIDSHVSALLHELELWRTGKRDPIAISGRWIPWFSASAYAKRLAELIKKNS